MSRKIKMSLVLPCIADIETVAHSGLDKLGAEGNIATDKIEVAKMLVNEAIINAIEHGSSKKKEIRLQFQLDDEQLLIYVRDYGKGFDINNVEEPNIDTKVHGDYKRGWGFKLMQTLSDYFKIESTKDGTKIYMYLKLNHD